MRFCYFFLNTKAAAVFCPKLEEAINISCIDNVVVLQRNFRNILSLSVWYIRMQLASKGIMLLFC